jgi:hypothetical protein
VLLRADASGGQAERRLALQTLQEVKNAVAVSEAARERVIKELQIALQSERSILEVASPSALFLDVNRSSLRLTSDLFYLGIVVTFLFQHHNLLQSLCQSGVTGALELSCHCFIA